MDRGADSEEYSTEVTVEGVCAGEQCEMRLERQEREGQERSMISSVTAYLVMSQSAGGAWRHFYL